MKKELTQEQLEKRKKLNLIISKTFGIISLVFFFSMMLLVFIDRDTPNKAIEKFFKTNNFLGEISKIDKSKDIFIVITDKAKFEVTADKTTVKKIDVLAEEEVKVPFLFNEKTNINENDFNILLKETIPYFVKSVKLKKQIDELFSVYDGSHIFLVKEVKNRLNDADSFEHVETKYKYNETDKTVGLLMTFRATNGFGAKMLGTAIATSDLKGNIVFLDIQ